MSINKHKPSDASSSNSKQKLTVTILVLSLIVIVLLTFIFGKAFTNSNVTAPNGSAVNLKNSASANSVVAQSADIRDGKQYVKLSMSGSQYILTPSPLVVNIPVVMTVDMSTVYGCMKDIVIPQFNVRKYVSSNDNIIEFTPNKLGSFGIQCSMNMGKGTFTVVESSTVVASTAATSVDASASVPSSTCGGSASASTGGCGGSTGGCGGSGGSCGGSGSTGGCGCGSR